MKATNRGKQMKSVWRIAAASTEEKAFGKHPTQKPVALIERCLLASTKQRDLVLDPFNGGGTTGVACLRSRRSYLGMELEPAYIELSIKRFETEIGAHQELLRM
jgi:site-specific DNA-methyltransferase (adenine-specific)